MAIAGRIRRFLEALSRPPVHAWPDGVQHHGARLLVLLALGAVTYLLFPVSPLPSFPNLDVGKVTDQDIIAQVGFPVFKSAPDLAQEQFQAASAVAPTFRYDSTAVDSMRTQIDAFLTQLDSAAATPGDDVQINAALSRLLASYSLPYRDDVLALLRSSEHRSWLRRSLDRTMGVEILNGVASTHELEESGAPEIRIIHGDSDRRVRRDSVLVPSTLWSAARAHLPANAPAGLPAFQQLVLVRLFVPSLRLDRAATEAARESARQAVPIKQGDVIAGERIIQAHTRVGQEDMQRLSAYQAELARRGRLESGPSSIMHIAGALILNLLILSIFGILLFFYRRAAYQNFRHVLLLAVLLLLVMASAAVITRTPAPVVLVPIAFVTLVIAVLWDGRMALNFALITAILLGIQAPMASMYPLVLLVVGGASAALSVRVVRRRAQGLILGAVVAGAYCVACIGLGLLLSWEAGVVLERAVWGTVNGVVSAILAMGFLPLFETFTRITTDQTLLELADLNRPLLKRLSLEASGTYAHSINVANLAEAAARTIDANALLARVGAYYHDVGKMATPQYFIENQARGRNPHDRLDPVTSASIVRNHVAEGIRLADQANLPDAVKAFIPEHHGTQPIGFFLEQARQRHQGEELDPADFAYPGPRPQTRETAILMLADSAESAAKVLHDPTPERIRTLVDRIVEAKIELGQLEEAPLTFRELTLVKQQLVAVLSGMYHHRIDYPLTDEIKAEAEAEAAAEAEPRREAAPGFEPHVRH